MPKHRNAGAKHVAMCHSNFYISKRPTLQYTQESEYDSMLSSEYKADRRAPKIQKVHDEEARVAQEGLHYGSGAF